MNVQLAHILGVSTCGHGAVRTRDGTCLLCQMDKASEVAPGISRGTVAVALTPSAKRLTPEQARKLADKIDRELAKRSLAEFVRQAWSVLEGATKLIWNWHIEALCEHVQALFEGWLVDKGFATEEMIARVDAHWKRHGLTRVQGELLVQNMIVNVAPISLKSRIIMAFAPAWMWLHAPSFKFGASSANDLNVKRDSLAHRDLVTSEWYRKSFDSDPINGKGRGILWSIRDDADAVGDWANTAGGERKSRTLLAGFTGMHVDGQLIDDPDDAQKVWNESKRRETQGQFTRAIENRVNDETCSIRIVCQQRVHVDDLTAYLLATKTWTITKRTGWMQLCIAMEFGMQPREVAEVTAFGWRDPRTMKGETLIPSRYPQRVLDDKRESLGSHGFEAQYNQNPTPLDGGMFKRSFLRFFVLPGTDISKLRKRPDGCRPREGEDSDPPVVLGVRADGSFELDWLTLTIDCSNGSESSSASAVGLLVVGGKGTMRFVFDDRTRVMGILEMYAAIKRCVRDWPVKRILIELKAAGSSVIAELNRAISAGELIGPNGKAAQVVVDAVTDVKDSKVTRAHGMLPAYEQGLVFLLDGAAWLYPQGKGDEGHVGEVTSFPNSKRNDRIDSMSQLMTFYRLNGEAAARAAALNVW